MRLATRTGLASFVAASITLLAVGSLFRGYFATVLQDRVDNQLLERAETAPILAAVAERLSQSELRTTLEGARVVTGGDTDLARSVAGRASARHDRRGMVNSARQWRSVAAVHRRSRRRSRSGRHDAGAAGGAARRCRRAGHAAATAGDRRDDVDLGGRRTCGLPPRQGGNASAHCVASRHGPNRRRRARYLACRPVVWLERGRRRGDDVEREPPAARRRDQADAARRSIQPVRSPRRQPTNCARHCRVR